MDIYLNKDGFTPCFSCPISFRFCRLTGFLILILLMGMHSFSLQAGVISLDLRSPIAGSILDDREAGVFEKDGLMSAFEIVPSGERQAVFNQTSGAFGINTLGTSDDSSALLDAAEDISESLMISFSETVSLRQLVFSAFSRGEQALIIAGENDPLILGGLTAAIDVYSFSSQIIHAGEYLLLSHYSGNGFSFDEISVSLVQVPEPLLPVLLLSGLLIVFSRNFKKSVA